MSVSSAEPVSAQSYACILGSHSIARVEGHLRVAHTNSRIILVVDLRSDQLDFAKTRHQLATN